MNADARVPPSCRPPAPGIGRGLESLSLLRAPPPEHMKGGREGGVLDSCAPRIRLLLSLRGYCGSPDPGDMFGGERRPRLRWRPRRRPAPDRPGADGRSEAAAKPPGRSSSPLASRRAPRLRSASDTCRLLGLGLWRITGFMRAIPRLYFSYAADHWPRSTPSLPPSLPPSLHHTDIISLLSLHHNPPISRWGWDGVGGGALTPGVR